MKYTAMDIIEKHIQSDMTIETATSIMDYKTINKEMDKLSKLYEKISKDIDLAMEVYKTLLNSSNATTLLNSSAECLKLGIYIDKAIDNLKSISKRKDLEIVRFNAEMVLRVWHGEFEGRRL